MRSGVGEVDERDTELRKQAWAAQDAKDWPTAARIFEDLATRNPDDPETPALWYDAALAHKFLRDWPRAFELGRNAARLAKPGVNNPAFWNLGIAATVLSAWSVAREAWIGYGITLIEPGADEIAMDLGPVCIRLKGEDGPSEVVWGRRICPTRARITSIPMAVAGRRFGDIVLHDGEPVGRRKAGERTVAVFDELLVWRASEMPTWRVEISAPHEHDYEALADLFGLEGLGAEPAASMHVMCKCCSEGTIDYSDPDPTVGAQPVWLAAPRDDAERLLSAWQDLGTGQRTVGRLHSVH